MCQILFHITLLNSIVGKSLITISTLHLSTWNSEKWSNLPKVTQLVNSRVTVWTQTVSLQSLSSFSSLNLPLWYSRKRPGGGGHLTNSPIGQDFIPEYPPPLTGSSSLCLEALSVVHPLSRLLLYSSHQPLWISLSGPNFAFWASKNRSDSSSSGAKLRHSKLPKYHPMQIFSSPAYIFSCPILLCLTNELRGKSSCCVVKRNKSRLRSGIQRPCSLLDFQDTHLSWLSLDS